MQQHVKYIVLLLVTALLWSAGGFLIKMVAWSPLAIAGGRSIIAACVTKFAFRHYPISFSRETMLGAVVYSLMVILFVTATKLTTAANAILLQYTAPIYIALFGSWLLHEKTSRADWLTIFITLGGMVFFFFDRVSAGGMLGNLLAVISGICFAGFVIIMRRQKNGSPFSSVFWGNILTFVVALPALSTAELNTTNCSGILLLGTFQLGLAYVLYSVAIKHVQALEATLITTFEPLLNPVWVFLLLGEQPGFYSLIGGLVVLIGISTKYIFEALPAHTVRRIAS